MAGAGLLLADTRRRGELIGTRMGREPRTAGELFGRPYGSSAQGQAANAPVHAAEQYRHNSGSVYSIIRLIYNRMAGFPLRHAMLRKPGKARSWKTPHSDKMPYSLKGRSEDAELMNESLTLDTFSDPNPIYQQWHLMAVTVASLEITGWGFWWLRKLDNGKGQIWHLPTSWVRPWHCPDEYPDKLFAFYEIRAPGFGEPYFIPGDEICAFSYPDPQDPLGALSPLQAMARSVISDQSIDEAQQKSFANCLNPSLAIIVGRPPETAAIPGVQGDSRPELTREQRQTMMQGLKQQYRGVVNSGEPLILDGLIRDVKPIWPGVREMDFKDSSLAIAGKLARGWAVNPISLGQVEGANRASASVAEDHLFDNCLMPRVEMFSQVFTARVVPFFEGPNSRTIAYLEPRKSQDAELELRRHESMLDRGAMSINEVRKQIGLPAIRNGDGSYVVNTGGQFTGMDAEGRRTDGPSSPTPASRMWVSIAPAAERQVVKLAKRFHPMLGKFGSRAELSLAGAALVWKTALPKALSDACLRRALIADSPEEALQSGRQLAKRYVQRIRG